MEVENPYTQQMIATVPRSDPIDVARAVDAARVALPGWRNVGWQARASYLRKIRDGIEARRQELATTIALELGCPIGLSAASQVGAPLAHFGIAADLAAGGYADDAVGASIVRYESAGVVAALTPWNFPLHLIAAKVAYALAAGCTVVLKPSELAPLNSFLLADIIHDAGVPSGVFNLVTGDAQTGSALVASEGIDLVSFTGSVGVGRRVAAQAGTNLKRVVLELGGKSACVVLEGGDLEQAVVTTVRSIAINSGQRCNAQSRLIVHRDRLRDVEEVARSTAVAIKLGDPLDPATDMGPVVSSAHRDAVWGRISAALQDGARLVIGGTEEPRSVASGYFVAPTVIADAAPGMPIVQEEVFGPVLAVQTYVDEDEAIQLANGTPYGLAAGIWAADLAHADDVARRIDAGMIHINGAAADPCAPFGGRKQSGFGSEFGRYGLHEYLQPKAVHGAVASPDA